MALHVAVDIPFHNGSCSAPSPQLAVYTLITPADLLLVVLLVVNQCERMQGNCQSSWSLTLGLPSSQEELRSITAASRSAVASEDLPTRCSHGVMH